MDMYGRLDTIRVYYNDYIETTKKAKKYDEVECALTNIRAEIEAIDTVKVKLGNCMNIIKSPQRIKDEVLEIIDKYKAESEDKG